MRISDWSSDVCSSDLNSYSINLPAAAGAPSIGWSILGSDFQIDLELQALQTEGRGEVISSPRVVTANGKQRSEEHTSGLQSLMRSSYAVFCLKKKNCAEINPS